MIKNISNKNTYLYILLAIGNSGGNLNIKINDKFGAVKNLKKILSNENRREEIISLKLDKSNLNSNLEIIFERDLDAVNIASKIDFIGIYFIDDNITDFIPKFENTILK